MKKVLIFDFGASSGRAMLCGFDNSILGATEIYRFPNGTENIGGKLCWNIDRLFAEMGKAIDKAQDCGFDAVSVDTWGVDFALLDESGGYVQKPVSYRDGRTDGLPEKLFETIPEKELYMRTGIKQDKINTMYQLLAIKEKEPKLLEKAAHMLMMPDLITYKLTGEMISEYTNATTTGLIDPKTKNWDYELIEKLGLPKRIFGKIVMPGEQVGYLKADYTDREIPVFAGTSHDTAGAVLAVPSEEKRFAYISCGTWAVAGTELKEPIINDTSFECGLTNEGGCGGSVIFQKNITGTWFLQEFRRYFNSKGEVFTFNDMAAFAKSAPPFIAKINPNDPLFSKPGDMPKKVEEYCEKTGQTKPVTISQKLRVIYESLAAEFALTLDQIEKAASYTYPVVHICGGGSQDSFLCQLTADAIGRTVVAGPKEATAIGNAVSVLTALGEMDSIAQARAFLRHDGQIKEYLPNLADGDGRR